MQPKTTTTELKLKRALNERGLYPMSQYQIQLMTVDLCFLDIRLIIEVDSSLHNRPEIQDKDNVRNWKLKQLGYTVLRFSNNAVNSSLAGVVLNVQRYVTSLS